LTSSAELRDRIYDFLFADQTRSAKTHLAPLLTCRRIFHEARCFAFAQTTFVITDLPNRRSRRVESLRRCLSQLSDSPYFTHCLGTVIAREAQAKFSLEMFNHFGIFPAEFIVDWRLHRRLSSLHGGRPYAVQPYAHQIWMQVQSLRGYVGRMPEVVIRTHGNDQYLQRCQDQWIERGLIYDFDEGNDDESNGSNATQTEDDLDIDEEQPKSKYIREMQLESCRLRFISEREATFTFDRKGCPGLESSIRLVVVKETDSEIKLPRGNYPGKGIYLLPQYNFLE
jgi:hypothetical protein